MNRELRRIYYHHEVDAYDKIFPSLSHQMGIARLLWYRTICAIKNQDRFNFVNPLQSINKATKTLGIMLIKNWIHHIHIDIKISIHTEPYIHGQIYNLWPFYYCSKASKENPCSLLPINLHISLPFLAFEAHKFIQIELNQFRFKSP